MADIFIFHHDWAEIFFLGKYEPPPPPESQLVAPLSDFFLYLHVDFETWDMSERIYGKQDASSMII